MTNPADNCNNYDNILAVLERIQQQALEIADLNRRLTELDDLRRRIAALEALRPVKLDGSRLPPMSALSKLEVQIFHDPSLAHKKHPRKTEWSLRLTAHVNGKRAKPDINVTLYSARQFYDQAMTALSKKHAGSEAERNFLDSWASDIRQTDFLGGMLRESTKGAGSPYNLGQFCLLSDHLDKPEVIVAINGEPIHLARFVPGLGMKENRAKWYCAIDSDELQSLDVSSQTSGCL